MRRWCTRVFKISPSKSFLKVHNLEGIEEKLGMMASQSQNRAKLNPERHISDKWRYADGHYTKFITYESLPIFRWETEEVLEIMQRHEIRQNPVMQNIGWHGCMWCPNRNADYYYQLKHDRPEMYAQCEKWRKIGSRAWGKKGEYHWFSEGKGSRLSQKRKREHPELIEIM